MNLCFLKKITIGLLMFTAGSFSCPAQDLIANQAPTDRRVRSVDSVALQRLLAMQKVVGSIPIIRSIYKVPII